MLAEQHRHPHLTRGPHAVHRTEDPLVNRHSFAGFSRTPRCRSRALADSGDMAHTGCYVRATRSANGATLRAEQEPHQASKPRGHQPVVAAAARLAPAATQHSPLLAEAVLPVAFVELEISYKETGFLLDEWLVLLVFAFCGPGRGWVRIVGLYVSGDGGGEFSCVECSWLQQCWCCC